MKIGLDIHGVINKYPKFFSELSKLFVENGNQIHIITGSTVKENSIYGKKNLEYLKENRIFYTHIFSIVDYHEEQGAEIVYQDAENPWIDSQLWNKTKAEYCKKHNIDIMFDDSTVYGKFFETPFALFTSIQAEN